MLILYEELLAILKKYNIKINGVLHVGAHECEENGIYLNLGIDLKDILWIEAIEEKVQEAKNKGCAKIYQAVITDKDDDEITFNISNNVQSSSIFQLGTHKIEHPWVYYTDSIKLKTITIDTFSTRFNENLTKYNMWNFDIQGAELLALKGGIKSLENVDLLYLEVNEKPLYEGCALIDELDLFLSEKKFKRVLTKMSPHGWGDAIYERV